MPQQKPDLAQKWYDAGVSEHNQFLSAFKRMRGHVSDAGFYFLKARNAAANGNWEIFLESNAAKMKPRTVRFYMQLTEALIAWVKMDQPALPDSKLQDACRLIMMQSPKPLVALLRDLRLMLPFGEYDAVKYAQRKSLGAGQLELDFAKVISSFDALDHFGEANFTLIIPPGTTEEKALDELEQRLDRALTKIRERKAQS